MPLLDIKTIDDVGFSRYPSSPWHQEIDLLDLVDIFWRARKRIILSVCAFVLAGLIISFLLPQKWTSNAIVTPPEATQWNALRQTLASLQVLGVQPRIERVDVFNLFIKKFRSQSLFEEYIAATPSIMAPFKKADIDPMELHRAIVEMAGKMVAVDDSSDKKTDPQPYSSWTLSFTGPEPLEAQSILDGYIRFIGDRVVRQTMAGIRDALALQTRMEKDLIELERVKLVNIHETEIKRLDYSLQIARAAGIVKPVYSNGQAVKDDPDFSVALGADGIARKLEIEKAIRNVNELNADLRNREYRLEQLEKMNVGAVIFPAFKYQLAPSLPMKKDGPGRALIVALCALSGAMVACGGILLRQAMAAHRRKQHGETLATA